MYGQAHPPEVHWIVVRLSTVMPKEDVAVYTGVPARSVDRILHYYRVNGTVKGNDLCKEKGNRRRNGVLRDIDLQVSVELYKCKDIV